MVPTSLNLDQFQRLGLFRDHLSGTTTPLLVFFYSYPRKGVFKLQAVSPHQQTHQR